MLTKVEFEIPLFNEMADTECESCVDKNSDMFYVKYQGRKYEISHFLKHHPGGRQTLNAYKGLALDQAFKGTPHSQAAFHLFKDFELNNKAAYEDIEVKSGNLFSKLNEK